MVKRAAEEGRSDDTPEAIRKRLEIYDRETAPLVEYYRSRHGNVVGIRADRPDRRGVRGDPEGARPDGQVIIRKSPAEIERMARAGEIVAASLALVGEHVRPGVTTAELDTLAEEFIRSQGGVPTFKGYRGYPAATCLSPNSMIVHGIPGPFELGEGDILSVDIGVTLEGFVADSAYTFPVGEISPEAERLLEVGQAALAAGIAAAQAGNRLSDISHAVQQVDRVGRLLGRPQPRRARRRPLHARGPADPELRACRAAGRCSPRG